MTRHVISVLKNTNHIGQHVFDKYLAQIVFLYSFAHSVRNVLSRKQNTIEFAALFMKYVQCCRYFWTVLSWL